MRPLRFLVAIALIIVFGAAPLALKTLPKLVAGCCEGESGSPERMGEESTALCGNNSLAQRQRSARMAAPAYQLPSYGSRVSETRATLRISHRPGSEHSGRNGIGTALLT